MLKYSLFFLLLIVALLILVISFKRKKQTHLHKKGFTKKELLLHLKDMKTKVEKNTEAKSLYELEITELESNIDTVLNALVEDTLAFNQIQVKAKLLESQYSVIQDGVLKIHSSRSILTERIEKTVTEFKFYISKYSFYPKDFLFEANMLQGSIHDMNAVSLDELQKTMIEIEVRLKEFEKNLHHFLTLSNRVMKLIEKNADLLSGNDKQRLYFLIHNGQLDEAESFLDHFLPKKDERDKNLNK